PRIRLICLDTNKGFAAGNNEGITRAAGRYILLLNSDAYLTEGVLKSTTRFMDEHPDIGILGCKLTNPDGTMQPSARMLPGLLNKIFVMTGLSARYPASRIFGRVDFSWWDHSHPREVGWVVGAYFLIRRKTLEEIGLLDERYFLYFEEIDYCRTAREKLWNVVFYPHAQVIHLGGQSAAHSGSQVSSQGTQLVSQRIRSEFRYYRKWHGILRVVLSAVIEISWNGLVFLKNMPDRSPNARHKRQDTLITIKLILSALVRDRFGKGQPYGPVQQASASHR
ncbi:MAG TPA: glycosyltransferase, partial [Deltaproteobacteria bacterium]|nr:glycosyltransferase [Deltaproteobacteria bacterium]